MNKLNVVVPSTGNPVCLRRLLASLESQTLAREDFSVFVVLNGVEENKRSLYENLCAEFDVSTELTLLDVKGVNSARSYGLKRAQAPIIFFIDDDCEVDNPHLFEWHLRYHEQNPALFAVGGGYQLPANTGFFDELYNDIQMRWLHGGRSDGRSRFLLGGNFSIKRDIAAKLKLDFDSYITYGGSETDFFRQALRENLWMLTSDKDLLHHTSESFKSLNRKIYHQGRGAAYTDKKYGAVAAAGSDVEESPLKGLRRVLLLYFNYVFWFGYYRKNGNAFALLSHIFRDFWGGFHYIRTMLSDRLNLSVTDRKKKGKRF